MAVTRLLKPAEAGEVLGVHEQTVRRLVHDGKLRAVNVALDEDDEATRLRIREDDLQAFIDQRTLDIPA